MEEKLVLIGQAKEAEERRNQDMRRFADDRERHVRQQAEMVSSMYVCVFTDAVRPKQLKDVS